MQGLARCKTAGVPCATASTPVNVSALRLAAAASILARMSTSNHRISVSLPADLAEYVERRAESEERDLSGTIRLLVKRAAQDDEAERRPRRSA
jgi:CopG-like RHH_1 or ribbon-helix-helix domain, RHH_5